MRTTKAKNPEMPLGPLPIAGKPTWKLQPGRTYKRYEVRAVLADDGVFVWRTYVDGHGWAYSVETFYAWQIWQKGNNGLPPLLAHSVNAARVYRKQWLDFDRRRA